MGESKNEDGVNIITYLDFPHRELLNIEGYLSYLESKDMICIIMMKLNKQYSENMELKVFMSRAPIDTSLNDKDRKANGDHVMYSYRPSQIAVPDKEFDNLLRRKVGVHNVGFKRIALTQSCGSSCSAATSTRSDLAIHCLTYPSSSIPHMRSASPTILRRPRSG